VKEAKWVTAARMNTGQVGVVESIDGGHVLCSRLDALGIRPGKRIRKVSSAFIRGPSVFELGSSRLAIGFGMANRILIKTD
jgi:ferrous iron transport protein A